MKLPDFLEPERPHRTLMTVESIPFVTPVGLVEGDAVINVPKGDADTNGSKDFVTFSADGFDRAARLAFLLTGDVVCVKTSRRRR